MYSFYSFLFYNIFYSGNWCEKHGKGVFMNYRKPCEYHVKWCLIVNLAVHRSGSGALRNWGVTAQRFLGLKAAPYFRKRMLESAKA